MLYREDGGGGQGERVSSSLWPRLLPVATQGMGETTQWTSSISSVQGSQPTTGVFTSPGNGRRSGGQGLITSCCCCCSFSITELCLFVTPWTVAHQASLSFIISLSLLKLTSTELEMPSNHLILCRPLLLLPSIFPSIRVFSNELALHIR